MKRARKLAALPISFNTYLIIDVKISIRMSNNESPITVRHPCDTSTSTVERQSKILNLLHDYRHQWNNSTLTVKTKENTKPDKKGCSWGYKPLSYLSFETFYEALWLYRKWVGGTEGDNAPKYNSHTVPDANITTLIVFGLHRGDSSC